MTSDAGAAIEAFLRALGHDPSSPALRGTGARVASLYADELLDGYRADVASLFDGAIPAGRGAPLVVVRRIATHVVCPHHLTIGAGTAAVAYLPRDRVLGLGAVARVVDAYAHRLVLQEDASRAIADAFVDRLGAHGAACLMDLQHGCLSHHASDGGEKKRSARVTTVALAGACQEEPAARSIVLGALYSDRPRARAVSGSPRPAKKRGKEERS